LISIALTPTLTRTFQERYSRVLNKISTTIGIVSAIVAVIAFVYSVRDTIQRENEADLREWQKVIVYEIVGGAGVDGIDFDSIQAKYQDASVEYDKYVPREKLRSDELRRVILDLIVGKAIEHRADDAYALSTPPPVPPTPFNLNPAVGGAGDRLRGAVSLRDERFAGGFGRSPIGRSPDG
jgi:hypothetical protein